MVISMMRNIIIFFALSSAYTIYVAEIFFSVPLNLNSVINFLVVPISFGIATYLLCTGERWVRVVIAATIPVFPMAFAGGFADTGGINIAYIAPIMIVFSLGAGISSLASRYFSRTGSRKPKRKRKEKGDGGNKN